MDEYKPSCMVACPVYTDTQGYVQLVAERKYKEALELIKEVNPFPSVCGRICHHPCEDNCRRKDIDGSIAIRELKKFITENTKEYRAKTRHKAEIKYNKKVAIIGGGPSGLTAAHDIIKAGYPVTVYEKENKAGGMLSQTIPAYRLPEDIVQEDIEDIISLGVEIKTNAAIGKDTSFDDLIKDTYDAVIIATGLPLSNSLPLENIEADGVELAIPFLKRVKRNQIKNIPSEVIVIGGGNVAMDVARSARRLGAKIITIVCLENEEEIPAWDWEIEESLEEGMKINYRLGPQKILASEGKVSGVCFKKVTRVFDEEHRFSPQYDESALTEIKGQMVIITIGQHSDLTFLESHPELLTKNRLNFNKEKINIADKNIFACGEVVTGPGSAIEAVSSGHDAAEAVIHYLQHGDFKSLCKDELEPVPQFEQSFKEKIHKFEKKSPAKMSAEERIKNFDEFEATYTEADAISECCRCLACTYGAKVDEDKCVACQTCARICPFEVPVVKDVASFPSELCQTCGMCMIECPAGAIEIVRFPHGDILSAVSTLLDKGIKDIHFKCFHSGPTRISNNTIEVSCVTRLGVNDMLQSVVKGAKSITIDTCNEEQSPTPTTLDRFYKRMDRANKLLAETGVTTQVKIN
ncbi:MAG: FAD-dependent oxidoreductase [bacterium]